MNLAQHILEHAILKVRSGNQANPNVDIGGLVRIDAGLVEEQQSLIIIDCGSIKTK